jgi:hypothetical protein
VEIKPEDLPQGTLLLGSALAYKKNHSPSDWKKHSVVTINSTGDIELYMPNSVMSPLIHMANISDIKDIHFMERNVRNKFKLGFWKFSTSYTFLMVLLFFIFVSYTIYFQINEGYIYDIEDMNAVSENNVTEGVVLGIVYLFLYSTIFLPILLSIYFESRVPQWVQQESLTLHFENQPSIEFSNAPEWANAWRLLNKFSILSSILLVIGFIPPTIFIEFLIGIIVIYLVFLVIAYVFIFFRKDEKTEIGSLTPGNLRRFHRIIHNLHSLSTDDGVSADTSNLESNNLTVEQRVSSEIKEPLGQLMGYEGQLDQITKGEWKAMLTANKIYFSLAQIRRCTEVILYELIKQHSLALKEKNRTISPMMQRLEHIDAIPSQVIKWLEVIKAIANPSAHNFKEDINDFLLAFRAFVSFTIWYLESSIEEE